MQCSAACGSTERLGAVALPLVHPSLGKLKRQFFRAVIPAGLGATFSFLAALAFVSLGSPAYNHWSMSKYAFRSFEWWPESDLFWTSVRTNYLGVTRMYSRCTRLPPSHSPNSEGIRIGFSPTYRTATAPSWSFMVERESMPAFPPEGSDGVVEEVVFGFPFRSLQFRVFYTQDQATVNRPPSTIEPVLLNSTAIQANLIPAWAWQHDGNWPSRILWTGFWLNVLVWAFAFAVPIWLYHGALMFRRLQLQRSGRCPKCGYCQQGVGSDKPCPECGVVRAP